MVPLEKAFYYACVVVKFKNLRNLTKSQEKFHWSFNNLYNHERQDQKIPTCTMKQNWYQIIFFSKNSKFRQTQQINNSIILKQLSLNPNHQFCKNFPPISTLEIFSAKNSCRFTIEKNQWFFLQKLLADFRSKKFGQNFCKNFSPIS